MASVDTLLLTLLILHARWGGWRLMAALAFSFYGVMTFMAQIETAWFASVMTTMQLSTGFIRALFLQTIPVVLIFIPIAVVFLGKGRQPVEIEPSLPFRHPLSGWV